MPEPVVIHWFRNDLRLTDNAALYHASKETHPILPIYIIDTSEHERALGAASNVWLHESLRCLSDSLSETLSIFKGDPLDIFTHLSTEYAIKKVYWNTCYHPASLKRDKTIKAHLKTLHISTDTYNSNHLWEPGTINKSDGSPYKVFTPYYQRGCLESDPPRKPLKKPALTLVQTLSKNHTPLNKCELIPKNENWPDTLLKHTHIGEEKAYNTFTTFAAESVSNYSKNRNFPHLKGTSGLSANIHFGEISVHQIWHYLDEKPELKSHSFLRQLVWREFSYHLLVNFPQLPTHNLQEKFNQFPWKKNDEYLKKWQQGLTGYPIVDAGMRQLWQTGHMHNRLRMIVGSFLVKNLLIHWKEGEAWFWDCLCDANLANNVAGWQWVAGCGADAAPYFRIFNPITQGTKFDATGKFTKTFIPELSKLPVKYLFNPWEAPEDILKSAQITLGETYPKPIVDVKESRLLALDAFASIKKPI